MQCPECGHEYPAGAKFCMKCGAGLPPSHTAQAESGRNPNLAALVSSVGVTVVIGAAILVVALTIGSCSGAGATATSEPFPTDDEDAQTYLSTCEQHLEQEEWEDAVVTCSQAAELDPELIEAYSHLGYACLQVGDMRCALGAYSEAAERDPDNYVHYQNLAVVYYEMELLEKAILEATQALELAPDSPKPAIEEFIAKLRSELVQDLLAEGRSLLEAGDWTGAQAVYEHLLSVDANNPIAHSALALIYAKRGDIDRAITENLAVIDLLPDDYDSHRNLAALYGQQGDFAKALSAAEKALALAPEEDVTWLEQYLEELRTMQGSSSSTAQPGQRAGDLAPARRNRMYSAPPPLVIDPTKSYQATIVTEKGDIVVELYADRVPTTVNSFVFLAREGFYDDTTFHRVIPGFMAQAGDPLGSGTGGPGYTFADEFDETLRHDGPGVLSMANRGANTNGSQFFITYAATDWLDGRHAVFGRVIEGMDVLNSLTPRDPGANPGFEGDRILTIRVEEQ